MAPKRSGITRRGFLQATGASTLAPAALAKTRTHAPHLRINFSTSGGSITALRFDFYVKRDAAVPAHTFFWRPRTFGPPQGGAVSGNPLPAVEILPMSLQAHDFDSDGFLRDTAVIQIRVRNVDLYGINGATGPAVSYNFVIFKTRKNADGP